MKEFKITKPCDKNWDEMLPTSKGAFCQFCKEEVFDISEASHDEIIQYIIRASQKKTCVKVKELDLESANTFHWFDSVSIKRQVNFIFALAISLSFSISSYSANTEISNPILMGGMLIPHTDSSGYYPEKISFGDYNEEEVKNSQLEFNLLLKNDSILVDYYSPQMSEIEFSAYTISYDSLGLSYKNDSIINEISTIDKGNHHFIIRIKDGFEPIHFTIQVNGVSRQGTLYPRYHFEGYPAWMY